MDQEEGDPLRGFCALHVAVNRPKVPVSLAVALIRMAPKEGLDLLTAGRGHVVVGRLCYCVAGSDIRRKSCAL